MEPMKSVTVYFVFTVLLCSNRITFERNLQRVCLCAPRKGWRSPGVSAPLSQYVSDPPVLLCAPMVLLQVLQALPTVGVFTAAALIRDSEAATGQRRRAHHDNQRFDSVWLQPFIEYLWLHPTTSVSITEDSNWSMISDHADVKRFGETGRCNIHCWRHIYYWLLDF